MSHAALSGHVAGIDRGRRLLVAAVLLLAGLAWAATILIGRSPAAMSVMPGQSSPLAAALFAGMWLLMIAAMMLPAVTPVVLLFRTVQRQRRAGGRPNAPVAVFVGGYLAIWLLAGLGADLIYTLAQTTGTHLAAGLALAPYAGGAILALAGLYQFTALKHACLKHCRSPLHFVMHGWRDGYGGAARMGATHGLYCLGCCGGIMAVLFVVGLMNLGWMAALSLLILAEKLAPRGVAIGRLSGALFIALGLLMALQPRLFPAAGLASAGNMGMAGMSTRPATSQSRTYRALAGPYALTLTIASAQRLLTPAQARRPHARAGEVMRDGNMAGAMATTGVQYHLELRVTDRAMGMAVAGAGVTLRMQKAGEQGRTPALTHMYGVKEDMNDLRYAITASLKSGTYRVYSHVHGYAATFLVRVP